MLQGHKYKAAFQYTFRYTISQIHECQKKKTKKHLDIITVYHTFATQIRLLGRDEVLILTSAWFHLLGRDES